MNRKYEDYHMAIHFTGDRITPRIIIQPRDKRGRFLSPIRRASAAVRSAHITVDGHVVSRTA